MHVQLGAYAPSAQGANVVPNTVPLSLTPTVPTAAMEKSRAGCHRKRMGKAGTRCFCSGKLVKNSRC